MTELSSLHLPAGDLRRYDSGLDAQSVAPSVPLETARTWLRGRFPDMPVSVGIGKQAMLETAVVHVPLYFFRRSSTSARAIPPW